MTATRKKPANQGASRSKSKKGPLFQRVPGWLWLVTGLMAGFMLALLVKLAPGAAEPSASETVRSSEVLQQEIESSKREPVFDFYKLLPESEVVVPEPATTTAKPAPVPKPSVSPGKTSSRSSSMAMKDDESRYLLQTGSFRNKNDAERLRAQLILWGLDARIQQVQVKSGEYWHRVQVGPLSSMGQVNNVQETLAEHKVDSLLLKLR